MAQIKKFSNPKHKKTTIITFIVKASLQKNKKKKKKIPVLKNLHYINDSLWPTKERVQ